MPSLMFSSPDGSFSVEKNAIPTLKHLIAQLLGDGTSDSRSKAALALQYLSLNSDNAMAILNHPDALKALRFVLMNGSQDDKEYAAGAIAHLAVNEEAEHIISNTEGIIPALVALLKFGTDKGKQQAATALENLSVSNGLAVCSQDGVVEGLTQMILNTECNKGMEIAAAVLQNLALIPECRRKLQTPALFRGLVNILLFGSPKAKEDSAAAIGNLAASEEIVDEAMQSPSLLDGLVDLMLTGSDRGKSDAATSIGNLSIRDDMRSKILDHPGLLKALDSMLNSLSERHRGEAAFCIQNLSICSIPQKIRIAKYGRIVDGLVNLVSRPNLHSQYQEDASSALLNLMVGCSENKKHAIRIQNFMHGIIYCMRYGSDRSQENATAILQNLAYNDHEIRLFVIGYPEALKFLGELILIGSHKTQEHALAAVASIARSKQGAVAMLEVRGMLESLVMMTQSGVLSIRTFAACALQAFTQYKQTADSLIRNLVATRAFLPLLEGDERNEQLRRVRFLSATGFASLCAVDSRIIDIMPENVKSILVGAVSTSLEKPHISAQSIPSADLLRNLHISCLSENARIFVASNLSDWLVRFLKEASMRSDVSGDVIVETIKLCWQLSFDNDSKALLLASGIFDVLSIFQLPRYAEANEIQFWASGVMLQFQFLNLKQFSIPLHDNSKEIVAAQRSFFVIHDPADCYVVEKVVAMIEGCGHRNKTQLYNHSDKQWHSVDLINFASALTDNSWIFIAMSNKSELNPYCRYKMEQAMLNCNQVMPLIVEPGYEPHGHFRAWPSVLECTENVLEGGRSSALLDIVRTLKESISFKPAPLSEQNQCIAHIESETAEDTVEIALTLALEYGERQNSEAFCAQVRMDVATAANLRQDKVRVLKVVAGRAATLDLSSLDATIDLHSFTTLTLAVRGDTTRSPFDIVEDLQRQVTDAGSKLRSGALTSSTVDVMLNSSAKDGAAPEKWQQSPLKSNSIRDSCCSPFELGSVSSETRSNSAVNVSSSNILSNKSPPICDASTQSDLLDYPAKWTQQDNSITQQSTEKCTSASAQNETVQNLPASLEWDSKGVGKTCTKPPTDAKQPDVILPSHCPPDPALSASILSVRKVADDMISGNLEITGNSSETEVHIRDPSNIQEAALAALFDREGSLNGEIEKGAPELSNTSTLKQESFHTAEPRDRIVQNPVVTSDRSPLVQSHRTGSFLEYQPDLQLHLLIRKQDLMIEALQGKNELLQMELQLYQDGLGQRLTDGSNRVLLAAHKNSPAMTALERDRKRQVTVETKSTGVECKILDHNLTKAESLPSERTSMESKATECYILPSDEQIISPSSVTKSFESKSVECNIVDYSTCKNRLISVSVQTLPLENHKTATESKASECKFLEFQESLNDSDIPQSTNMTRICQNGKANSSSCSWTESTLCNEKKMSEQDTLTGFASELLANLESKMETKLKSVVKHMEESKIRQQAGEDNFPFGDKHVQQSCNKSGQSANFVQSFAKNLKADNQLEATDYESLKMNSLLQTLAKITSDMLIRFESTLDSRLKQCVENMRDQEHRYQPDGAGSTAQSACSVLDETSVDRDQPALSRASAPLKNLQESSYHDSKSNSPDTVSLSPTRPSSPGQIISNHQTQQTASMRNAQLLKKERSQIPTASDTSTVSKIIAQYLPEYKEGQRRPLCQSPAKVLQSTVQRVHRPRLQQKSLSQSLSLIGPGNVYLDPSQPPSTPRGISFRQLAKPKAKRALISTSHLVDLDGLACQSTTSVADSDSWLLGNSCSSDHSTDTHTSASTLGTWALSPAMYKRSLIKDSVQLVVDCPSAKVDNALDVSGCEATIVL